MYTSIRRITLPLTCRASRFGLTPGQMRHIIRTASTRPTPGGETETQRMQDLRQLCDRLLKEDVQEISIGTTTASDDWIPEGLVVTKDKPAGIVVTKDKPAGIVVTKDKPQIIIIWNRPHARPPANDWTDAVVWTVVVATLITGVVIICM